MSEFPSPEDPHQQHLAKNLFPWAFENCAKEAFCLNVVDEYDSRCSVSGGREARTLQALSSALARLYATTIVTMR